MTTKTASPISDIANKVRKLLALANNNANEHERQVAMDAAQKLLDEHNLSMFDCQGEAETISHVEQQRHTDIKLHPFVRNILSAACRLYNTTFYMSSQGTTGNLKHPVLIGTPENIEVTLNVAAWLMDSVTNESKRLFSRQVDRNSFKIGASEVIRSRVIEMLKKPIEQPKNSNRTSLMVVRNALQTANDAYLKKHVPNLTQSRSRATVNSSSGYYAGREYGSNVSLNRQVTGSSTKRISG